MFSHEFYPENNTTLILLHSSNISSWMWGKQIEAITDYHLLVPDLPGFEKSNDQDWESLQKSAELVAELIRAKAKHGKAHLVGLSLGANLALTIAANHKEETASVFAASPSLSKPNLAARLSSQLLIMMWEDESYWRNMAKSYDLDDEDTARFLATGKSIKKSTAQKIYQEVKVDFPADLLNKIESPVLAVAGGSDAGFIKSNSLNRIRKEVANSKIALAHGLHHHWNSEDPDLFNAALRKFVNQQKIHPRLQELS